MKQNNQQITEKPALPTKTRIAAILMSIFGILNLLVLPFLSLIFVTMPGHEIPEWVNFIFFNGFFLCIAGLLLLNGFLLPKRRVAWYFSIGIIVCLTVIGIFIFPFLLPIMLLFAYLLLSDRKNFWKVAT